jgi:N,N'-diacetyllegionaminate synthase
MQIGRIRLDERIAIVAEIGNNHEGRFDVACRLVEKAAECGVDFVKFQTFRTAYFTSRADPARFDRLSRFELSYDQFRQLEKLARSLGVGFISTPLDLESGRFLEPLVDAVKIASGDNDFYPLIAQACRSGKPVIVSTGLADLAHLRRLKAFIETVRPAGALDRMAFLHCVCSYPVPDEQANLSAITTIRRELGGIVGYSDHTVGPEACLAAAALGARILEKHFTLDKHFSDFRDHQLSADPAEMAAIVKSVRRVEALLGDGEKRIQPSETATQRAARRSIVAGADLPAGHRLAAEDLTWIRPADGLPPGEEGRLVGRTLTRGLSFGEVIRPEDVA